MSWIANFINDLIIDCSFYSYLELGVAGGKTFNNVKCHKKIGVDYMNDSIWNINGVINKSTDEYFSSLDQNIDKFDLIFIDADHDKYSVKKDFVNSLKFLNENGIIILHDIYPLSKKESDKKICGNAYEFWINLVDNFSEETCVYIKENNCEGSVGVYFNKSNFSLSNDKFEYSYEFFIENKNKYIISKVKNYQEIVKHFKGFNEQY